MEIVFYPYKIRSLRESDAENIFMYLQDFEIIKFLANVPSPYLMENALSFVLFAHQKEIEKTEFHFAIANVESDILLGLIGVKEIDSDLGTCEIGYWLGKEHQNKGIMRRTIQEISKFCFGELKLTKIKAIVFSSNEASIKALNKNGFVGSGYSTKTYCNTILKEKMFEFILTKNISVSRETEFNQDVIERKN